MPASPSDPTLIARVLAGEVRAGARAMRIVDDRRPDAVALLKALHPHGGRAHVIGITGNPGSGKSTLTSALVADFRARGHKVGVVCVDPSSPFSGGAILGDRIRMSEHAVDDGVFIRSAATRGHLGGLSRSTADMVLVMDAMGYDPIFIETVGVGQDEVEVVRVAHTTAVVLVPGLGDEIQAIKAGLLEVADVFVVNKSDRDGADRTEKDLRMLQGLGPHPDADAWETPIVRTVAIQRQGIERLVDALGAHRRFAVDSPERRRARARHDLESVLRDRWAQAGARAHDAAGGRAGDDLLDRIASRELDPWSAADALGHGEVGDGQA
ncbi:MAG: methylmalonyl Co-A mutase-associated GTPase MeaB [Myxococcota bacterium]